VQSFLKAGSQSLKYEMAVWLWQSRWSLP